MKKANFTQADGFPFEEKTIDFMQSAYLEILSAVIGHFDLPNSGSYIISGCKQEAGGITSGIMFIDGELCPFAGLTLGDNTTKIAKIEAIEDAPFEGGNDLPTYYTYIAMENSNGSAFSSFQRVPNVPEMVNKAINWSDIEQKPAVVIDPANLTTTPPQLTVLQRIELLEKQNSVFQAGGGMVLWNKPANQIPDGWAEVVDWKGRIPVGLDNRTLNGNFINPEFSPLTSGQNDPGREGGKKGHVMTLNNLIEHSHGMNIPLHSNGSGIGLFDQAAGGNWGAQTSKIGSANPDPIPTLPPYRTVLFIEFIG